MGGLSPIHWILVILVIILLFGVKKIPDFAKNLGIGIKEFKKAIKEGDKEAEDAVKAAKTAAEIPEKKDDVKPGEPGKA
jgi:sec-independent protein translocase protein TatA